MPTRPRINLAGYHHIINRGVNRSIVFDNSADKEMFLQIINKAAVIHRVILHDYCLMDNHYHILIETEKENLSTFMRIVSANYSQYFNKRYQRSGHLWQDRYQSKYITSDEYLYTLIRYIEYNPVEAGLAQSIGEYPYTLSSLIFNAKEHYPCSNESLLIKSFDIRSLSEFLEKPINEEELEYLKEKQKQKIKRTGDGIKISQSKKFEEHFTNIQDKEDRNLSIINAYSDGYTQSSIAQYLNVSKSLVSKVIKSGDIIPWVNSF